MSVATSRIHLRSQVIQYKWNGTLPPTLQIPSEAFTAGWVMDQLKESEARCFVLRSFCYMWHVGSVRVRTKLRFALGLKQQALTWIGSSLGSEGGQTESSQKQQHPTRTQAEATLCLLPHWAHCLHLFHTFSLGPLFSEAGKWQVHG